MRPFPIPFNPSPLSLGLILNSPIQSSLDWKLPPAFSEAFRPGSNVFNMPFEIGGTYIYNPDLQFIVGVSIDVERKYPVIPGGGIRWKFQPKWVLNAVMPTPRLEYECYKNLT